MTRYTYASLLLGLAVPLGACGSDPADVAGTYTVAVTYDANQCELTGWNEGSSDSGIEMVISQSGSTASADVRGGTGIFLDFWLGASDFNGEVDEEQLDLVLIGTTEQSAPGCTYTMDAFLRATLEGDILEGTITYRPNPIEGTCGVLESCQNVQRFNGTRPPSP